MMIDAEALDALGHYIHEAGILSRYTTLALIFEQIIKSGYSPEELLFAVTVFSEGWGCRDTTDKLSLTADDLANFLDKKAEAAKQRAAMLKRIAK